MRSAIEALLGQRNHPDHPGLAYDLWRPLNPTGEDVDQKKEMTEEQVRWMSWVEGTPLPPDYPVAYQRWRDSFSRDGSRAMTGTLASRLLIGHGTPSPTGVGLTVHPTWGVPMIPGSALKGLLASYVQAVYGPQPDESDRDRDTARPAEDHEPGPLLPHPLDTTHPEPERALWQGPQWVGRRIADGPGPAYRLLFGAPRAGSDAGLAERLESLDGDALTRTLPAPVRQWLEGQLEPPLQAAAEEKAARRALVRLLLGERQGSVHFHDALIVPEPDGSSNQPLVHDVLTVHQRAYYNAEGGEGWPNDYDAPNPVSFLTVKPGMSFLFAVSGPEDWTRLAMDLLREALVEWGIGGKTSAGYGRFVRGSLKEVTSPEKQELGESRELQTFLAWFGEQLARTKVENSTYFQSHVLEALEQDWVERLKVLPPAAAQEARTAITRGITSRKQVPRRDAFLARVWGG